MTHTLHRRGDCESLTEDYVMLIMPAKGVNTEDAPEKMKQIWDLLSRYEKDLVNFGNVVTGNSHQVDIRALKEIPSTLIHAVFKDPEVLKACLQELKERDIGLSVVVSGIYDEVKELCTGIGLSPHTVEYSLGVHGKTDMLPGESILDITTMCGHAMVSPHLVTHMVEEIDQGRLTSEDAAIHLSRGCACGIFNPYRAAKLLKNLVREGEKQGDCACCLARKEE